ncbi:wos2 [Coprinopsis cinerea okayama7|uniref:Wos2 n=1 Tax=Coprinopsis cinerea (strain Okayama-7 / 130 / ATCC MYA-4618 / FGSC 9003) TaxID=240176 RepID=A8N283_COPC7|nr:wos2 [Coprinopsis cinerea okayama7\|eukprot:XP_001828956.1 wos2 [Coprinopsis cinerea okayama7\
MVQHPEVLWAQRSSTSDAAKNIIYLTVNLPNIDPSTLEYKLTANSIHFKAKAGTPTADKEYGFDIDLFEEVDPEASKNNLTTRSLVAVIRKKELKEEYWPRLTKEKVRNAFIKTDFDKWVDEDEQDGGAPDLDDMGDDFGMGGMGGMGGPGGMDFSKMMAQMGGGAGGFDPSSLGNLGGDSGPSMPSGDDSDSDDDGPPPLEDAEPAK